MNPPNFEPIHSKVHIFFVVLCRMKSCPHTIYETFLLLFFVFGKVVILIWRFYYFLNPCSKQCSINGYWPIAKLHALFRIFNNSEDPLWYRPLSASLSESITANPYFCWQHSKQHCRGSSNFISHTTPMSLCKCFKFISPCLNRIGKLQLSLIERLITCIYVWVKWKQSALRRQLRQKYCLIFSWFSSLITSSKMNVELRLARLYSITFSHAENGKKPDPFRWF